jgi:signal recognition particle subunit SEC65
MLDCCSYLKLPAEIEDKQYPRDWWLSRGRLRVTLFGPDGQPSNPEIATRAFAFVCG